MGGWWVVGVEPLAATADVGLNYIIFCAAQSRERFSTEMAVGAIIKPLSAAPGRGVETSGWVVTMGMWTVVGLRCATPASLSNYLFH